MQKILLNLLLHAPKIGARYSTTLELDTVIVGQYDYSFVPFDSFIKLRSQVCMTVRVVWFVSATIGQWL